MGETITRNILDSHVYCQAGCVNCPRDPRGGTKVHFNTFCTLQQHRHMCVCVICGDFYYDILVLKKSGLLQKSK